LVLLSLVKIILRPLLITPSLIAPGSLVNISRVFILVINKKVYKDIRNNHYKYIEYNKLIGQEARL
jgi:hypothetical protein